jgi:hypothetical protein
MANFRRLHSLQIVHFVKTGVALPSATMKRTLLFLLPIYTRPVEAFCPLPADVKSLCSRRGNRFPVVSAEKPDSRQESLPANLKRKVDAKRQPLGHVVPKNTKTKGCTYLEILCTAFSTGQYLTIITFHFDTAINNSGGFSKPKTSTPRKGQRLGVE